MGMRPALPRKLFKVGPLGTGWAVQCDDEAHESFDTKEEARAAANKQARACQDAGTPCRVEVRGELGYAGS